MVKVKRRLTYSIFALFFILNFIMIIQFGACSYFNVIWRFQADESVRDVAISDDGTTISVVGGDQNVYLFNNINNNPLWIYPANDSLFCTALSSDGNYIVTGSRNGYIRFFEKTSSEPLWIYHIGASAESLAICPDGSYMVVGCNNYHVYLFDKHGSSPIWSYKTINAHIRSVSISSDGELMAAASSTYDRGTTYLFNKSKSSPLWSFKSSFTHSLAMSSDGSYIVSGCGLSYLGENGNVTLFDSSSNDSIWCYDTTPRSVYRVDISNNGQFIAATTVSGDDNKFYFFESDSPNPIWIYNLPSKSFALATSNDGRYAAVGLESNSIYSFDTSKKILKWVFTTRDDVECVDISSEGDYIVGADNLGNAWLLRNINPPNLIPSFPIFITGIITTSTLIIVIWKIMNKKKEYSNKEI